MSSGACGIEYVRTHSSAAEKPFALRGTPAAAVYHLGLYVQTAATHGNDGYGHYYTYPFQYIPNLNKFLSFRVTGLLQLHYRQWMLYGSQRTGDDGKYK